MSHAKTFTGRPRHRQTRRSVRIVDRVARTLIALGGIGTVIAVSTVCIFLVCVAVPLFLPASYSPVKRGPLSPAIADCLHFEIDEYRVLGWAMSAEATLRAFRLDTGDVIHEQELFPDQKPTAWSFSVGGREASCGFADGSVRTIRLGFTTTFPDENEIPEDIRSKLADASSAVYKEGLLSRTRQGALRLQTVRAVPSEPIVPAGSAAVACVDSSSRPTGRVCCVLDDKGNLMLHAVRRRPALAREAVESHAVDVAMPYAPSAERGPPRCLLVSGQADNAYLIWNDGHLLRYDIRDLEQPRLAEQVDLVPESNQSVTALTFLPGKTTLVAGDSLGRVRAWFPTKPTEARTADGAVLALAHELSGPQSAVSSLTSSLRARLVAAAYDDGSMHVFQVTSARALVDIPAAGNAAGDEAAARLAAFTPKGDALVAIAGSMAQQWTLATGYPEVSPATLFRAVWYEGYEGPQHVWQSSGGGDDFEPKLGMIPLVFGTLKATIYSLLFAVPLALLSAVYSSEFLQPRIKARIKPAIEMMASLPSVVLGFVAALVVAPYVEKMIPAVLASVAVVPLTYLVAAYLWQMLPARAGLLLARWRFAFICATLPVGILASALVGPLIERTLFAGDLRSWVDGQIGSGLGGWIVLFLPLSALATALFIGRQVNPWLRSTLRGMGRERRAWLELVKFLIAVVVTVAGAATVGLLLDSLHLDPRGLVLDTYVQRNALVVGFVMGFAIIPLIYTIADDALSTVPAHLRSASLGAGATPWQTAIRVIIPTAMSGLFSAVMIGLGRAVGETMIVLMAAGNTPIMDWNIFNGFQTLSASIATELPEAVQGSAHYRTLFVAALALFVITFIVNTLAEAVRLRFRRRAYEL
ncbi:MAG TPA: ABC transporter permease subunit [Pirellulales bacterium]|nr:ABC transporter permease subunit [Pirellulales bacterium]